MCMQSVGWQTACILFGLAAGLLAHVGLPANGLQDDPDEELDQYEKACRMHERLAAQRSKKRAAFFGGGLRCSLNHP